MALIQTDMSSAPEKGRFLAENMHGDWLIVRRFDPGKLGDFSKHAVINGRQGIWWYPTRWMLIDEGSPASAHDDVARVPA